MSSRCREAPVLAQRALRCRSRSVPTRAATRGCCASAPIRTTCRSRTRSEQGFENRIAALVARATSARALEYTWWPQRRGFVRKTLGRGSLRRRDRACRPGSTRCCTTTPYYRSSYVFVDARTARARDIASFDDPRLAHAARSACQLVGNDWRQRAAGARARAPRHRRQRARLHRSTATTGARSGRADRRGASRSGEIDVAVVWGPLAGYFAQHASRAARASRRSPREPTAAARSRSTSRWACARAIDALRERARCGARATRAARSTTILDGVRRPAAAAAARRRPMMLTLPIALALAACSSLRSRCQREEREFQRAAVADRERRRAVRVSAICSPAASRRPRPAAKAATMGNAYAIARGQAALPWYNCIGCHAHGGGGIGPPLMDDAGSTAASPRTSSRPS